MSDTTSLRRPSLASRLGLVLRPKKSQNRLTKNAPPAPGGETSRPELKAAPSGNTQSRLQYGAIYRPAEEDRDEQTGERRDDTDLLHGLAHRESNDSLDSLTERYQAQDTRPPGEAMIASLPSNLWEKISKYISASDRASLAFANKFLCEQLGPIAWPGLENPELREEKIKFLLFMDKSLPNHLLCFLCVQYHLRILKGKERLKPTIVPNLLYTCPNFGKAGREKPPQVRLTPGHILPFTFAQLVVRARRYGPDYGIPLETLARRYKDPYSDWQHQSRYYIHKKHLLFRVVSRSFASPGLPPSGLRHLLYSREDYTPYFSVCAHWKDGMLMDICKCALGHIPQHRQTISDQLKKGPQIKFALRNPDPIVTLCGVCRPMRRCPECPTEYLVELKLSEDKNDPLVRFKQSIVVTRWSDLGDASSPLAREWAAVSGEGSEYDSFETMGKRAISGTFESQFGVTMPGQRLLSLNPKKEKRGEDGDGWY